MPTYPTIKRSKIIERSDGVEIIGDLTVSNLTSTRIPYVSTGGLFVDSANLTFDTTNGLILAAGSASALNLSSTSGTEVGGILFGADVNLYRSAENTLKTDDGFIAGLQSAINTTINSSYLFNIGGIHPSTGTSLCGAYNVYTIPATATSDSYGIIVKPPSTAASVFTSESLIGLRILDIETKGAGSEITAQYGMMIDAQTKGSSNYGFAISASSTYTMWLCNATNPTTAAGGITFGISGDTNLYRSAANVLKTDDGFSASTLSASLATLTNTSVGVQTNLINLINSSSNAGTATGILFQPSAASNRKASIHAIQSGVDGANWIDLIFSTASATDAVEKIRIDRLGKLKVYYGSSGIEFGDGAGGYDTNLYRSASNTLKTDDGFSADNFSVGATAGVSGTFTTVDGKTVTVTNGIVTSIV